MLSRVHWLKPELVAEVKYLTWTAGNPAAEVCGKVRIRGSVQRPPSACNETRYALTSARPKTKRPKRGVGLLKAAAFCSVTCG